jgi:hypothetical protein
MYTGYEHMITGVLIIILIFVESWIFDTVIFGKK